MCPSTILLFFFRLFAMHDWLTVGVPDAQANDSPEVNQAAEQQHDTGIPIGRVQRPNVANGGGRVHFAPGLDSAIPAKLRSGAIALSDFDCPRHIANAQAQVKNEHDYGQCQRLKRFVAPQCHQAAERSGGQGRGGQNQHGLPNLL